MHRRYGGAGAHRYCLRHMGKHSPQHVMDNETGECCVCVESIDKPLVCGHYVHKECVILSGKDACPVCRQPVPLSRRDRTRLRQQHRILNPRPRPSHLVAHVFTIISLEDSRDSPDAEQAGSGLAATLVLLNGEEYSLHLTDPARSIVSEESLDGSGSTPHLDLRSTEAQSMLARALNALADHRRGNNNTNTDE